MADHLPTRLLAAAGLISGLGTAFASSQAAADCEPFSVHAGDERTVQYLDHGESGPGFGDIRVGRRSLVDDEGNGIGYHRWLLFQLDTLTPDGEELSESFGDHVLSMDEGDIYFRILGESVAPSHETHRPTVTDFTGVVIGGTGAYKFARGTVDRSFDGHRGTFALDIRCD